MSYIVETVNLSKKFPVLKGYRDIIFHPFRKKEITALHDINIQVKEGDIFGLLGPNGAGKTTLIKILCTLVLPSAGSAYVKGFNVTLDDKSIRRVIGYVISEERSFYWRLSGRQNLKFFAKLNNIPGGESDRRIERLLDFLDLSKDGHRMFKDYSTGMRQKLAIARGLLTDPAILFMDEPSSGLDPVSAHNLKQLVKEKLAGEKKKTVIFATHNLGDAEELCSSIAIIRSGEVGFAGKIEDVKLQFRETKKYMMKLRSPETGPAGKIRNMPQVKRIMPLSNGSSGLTEIEIETGQEDSRIQGFVREIVDMGGEIFSVYEIEPTLEDLFSKIVSTK
ncbi:MAG: ABC transporter ATP-binding protein [Nitrospiraceae bacterium]|nr:MAG: ABC transporter ATP-binding protein [Nitrospiraceae bacterium]